MQLGGEALDVETAWPSVKRALECLVGEGTLPASASVQARCLLPHRNQLLLRGR